MNIPRIVCVGVSPLQAGYLGLLLRVRVSPVNRPGVHQVERVPGVDGGQGGGRQGALVLPLLGGLRSPLVGMGNPGGEVCLGAWFGLRPHVGGGGYGWTVLAGELCRALVSGAGVEV